MSKKPTSGVEKGDDSKTTKTSLPLDITGGMALPRQNLGGYSVVSRDFTAASSTLEPTWNLKLKVVILNTR